MRRVVDLHAAPELLRAYVDLRNRWRDLLLTDPVTVEGTRRWLETQGCEVRCVEEEGRLLGAAVLYPARGGEIAVFADEPGRGVGPELIRHVVEAARARGLAEVWAGVLPENEPARRAFRRAGFDESGPQRRSWRGHEVDLVLFRRSLAGSGAEHTAEAYGLRPEAADFPMMCVLAFVYVCNARCPSCPYTNSEIRASYRDAPLMRPETFRIIADECGPHGAWIRISGGGEPMLHPEAVELIEYARRAGARVGLITNGSRFTPESIRRLLEAGVDMIEFSVDAADPETYARVRPGLDWGRLVGTVESLVAARGRIGAPTKVIASGVNQAGVDLDAVARFWEPRVDLFQRRKFLTWGINDPSRSADPAPYLPPEQRVPCPFIFERLNIDSRGTVMVCGFDIAGRTNLGNVHETPIARIWRGEGFERYRRLHLERRGDEIELCRGCPDWRYRSWRHNYWRIVRSAEEARRARAGGLEFGGVWGGAFVALHLGAPRPPPPAGEIAPVRIGILQPGYLPWLGFFDQLARTDVFVIYDDVQYDKGGWRNRNRVKTAHGVRWLTVPVCVSLRTPAPIREVRIDNRTDWRRRHLRTLQQGYARAPHFPRYRALFEEAYAREWELLVDLDLHFIRLLAEAFGIDVGKMVRSSALGIAGERDERLLGICARFGADSFYEGAAGRDYIDPGRYAAAGVRVEFQDYRHPVYPQLHGPFVPGLSAVDLLFNCGEESRAFLLGEKGGAPAP